MGLTDEELKGSFRISIGKDTTIEDLDYFVKNLNSKTMRRKKNLPYGSGAIFFYGTILRSGMCFPNAA